MPLKIRASLPLGLRVLAVCCLASRSPVALSQDSSTRAAPKVAQGVPIAATAAPGGTAPATAKPAVAKPAVAPPASPTPAAASPAKKRRRRAAAAEQGPPAAPVPAAESSKLEPTVTYRTAALTPVPTSVYRQPEFSNYGDQFYLTLHCERTYAYTNDVVFEPALRTNRYNPATWDPYIIHQAYIESALAPKLSFTVGKKTEYEGSGFFVNPSDLLNENKDLFDPLYQQEGVAFSRLRYHGSAGTLGVGFIPRPDHPAQEGKLWLTASATPFSTELRLSVASQQAEKATTGLSVQRFLGGSLELHFDGRYQARQRDPAGPGNAYLRYSAYQSPVPDELAGSLPSLYYATGTRVIFTPRRSLALEAIIDQSGLQPADFHRMYADLATAKAQSNTVQPVPTRIQGRHYGFASYQDDDTVRATHLALNVLRNTDDGSVFAAGSVRFTLSPITSVELAPTFFRGGEGTEFGEMPFSHLYWLVFRGRF